MSGRYLLLPFLPARFISFLISGAASIERIESSVQAEVIRFS
jgi:hypothetical protein